MTEPCSECGRSCDCQPEPVEAIDALVGRMREALLADGHGVRFDDTIDSTACAFLIGISVDGLKHARGEGRGPPSFEEANGLRHRVRYRLRDVAEWLIRQARENAG